MGSHLCMLILFITDYLILYNNDLTGVIPTELGLLSNLSVLGLEFNQLSGTISTELGLMSNLSALYLNSNQLSGTILTELGLLSNLGVLNLGSNQLTGSVPTSLASLPLLSKSQSLLFPNKIQFLHYWFSHVHAHPPHYSHAVPLWQ